MNFRINEVYLVFDGRSLREEHILDICPKAQALKLDGGRGFGVRWVRVKFLEEIVAGKLGDIRYIGFWPFKRRTLIRS